MIIMTNIGREIKDIRKSIRKHIQRARRSGPKGIPRREGKSKSVGETNTERLLGAPGEDVTGRIERQEFCLLVTTH